MINRTGYSGCVRLLAAVFVAALGCNSDEVRQNSASNGQGSTTGGGGATDSASATVTDGVSATVTDSGVSASEAGSDSNSASNSGITETATTGPVSATDTDTAASATAGTDTASTDTASTATGTAATGTAATDSSGDQCLPDGGDSACESCLKGSCCDAYIGCTDVNEVACLCVLECTNLVQCALDCGLGVMEIGDLLKFALGGPDGCLLNQCGVVCPVAKLL